jgi:hypothetical protein
MKFLFKLSFGNITVNGTSAVSSTELDHDLIQRIIDTERFLELVLRREVTFEVIPSDDAKAVGLNRLDQLLEQDRNSR